LRRRIILAVILLAAFIVLLRVAVLAGEFDTVITAATFDAARENRTVLRAFLHRMPKGGDLHTHLAGAVYAERFIAWAAQQELCVDPQKVVVAKPQCDRAGALPVSDAMRDQKLYNRLVDAFSMRAFLPTPAVPTGHDEFFAVFDKFGAVSGSNFVDMTIDQLRRYDSENVQYVEFMVSSWCPDDRDRFVKAINETTDDASKLKTLEASGLGDCVATRRNVLTAALGKIRSALACDAPKAQPGCGVTFRYIIQVNRNNPPDEVFVQTAIAAARNRAWSRSISSDPKMAS
jgi:adenosine deaminase